MVKLGVESLHVVPLTYAMVESMQNIAYIGPQ